MSWPRSSKQTVLPQAPPHKCQERSFLHLSSSSSYSSWLNLRSHGPQTLHVTRSPQPGNPVRRTIAGAISSSYLELLHLIIAVYPLLAEATRLSSPRPYIHRANPLIASPRLTSPHLVSKLHAYFTQSKKQQPIYRNAFTYHRPTNPIRVRRPPPACVLGTCTLYMMRLKMQVLPYKRSS